jgi:predicted naringenin-chalcone synthase
MSSSCYLGEVVVEPGLHTYPQAELAEAFRRRIEDLEGAETIRSMVGFVYEHSAILERHLEVPLEVVEARTDWYRLVNEATVSLARRALRRLLEQSAIAAEIDALVVVSSSHAGFPSLGRLLQEELGLRLDATVYDVTGLGCAGPTHGLHLASLLLRGGDHRRVCVVCVDAMATHGESRVHDVAPSMSQLVAHCLASDGAAAIVVSADPLEGAVLSWERCGLVSRLWPGALGDNDFTADASNQPLISVGQGIRKRLLDELLPLLEGVDPDTTLFHPGGAALMRALGDARRELQPTLDLSTSILRRHGNVGSASVLWVLEEALRRGRRLWPVMRLVALGPGIVSTVLRCEGVRAPLRAEASP